MSFISRCLLFALMVVVLLGFAYLSLHWSWQWQWREQPVLHLTDRQQSRLASIEEAVNVYAYLDNNPRFVRALKDALMPIYEYVPNLQLQIINPNTDPVAVKKHDISHIGQIYVQVGDNGQRLDFASPEGIVRSILELSGGEVRQMVHLQGSGERAAFADTAGSWRMLYETLQSPQLNVLAIDLKQQINLPQNADLSVVADPDMRNQAHLNAALDTYLREGGNLLFTTDTQYHYLPPVLQEISGLVPLSGVVVDMSGQTLGLADPRVIPAAFSEHQAMTAHLTQLPLLPGTLAFVAQTAPASGWQRHLLLQSSAQSWNETSPITGHIEHNAEQGEVAGPLGLAWLLQREQAGCVQSIVILGDSDLFTAAALTRGGNLALAQSIVANLANTSGGEALDRPDLRDQFIILSRKQEWLWASFLLLWPFLFLALDYYGRHRFRRDYRFPS